MMDLSEMVSCTDFQKSPSYHAFLILFVLFVLILGLSFSFFYPIPRYVRIVAQVQEDNQILKLLVPIDDMDALKQETFLYANQSYTYSIQKIGEDYQLDENLKRYYEVMIQSNLDGEQQITNNVFYLIFKLPSMTIMDKIVIFFQKGMN